MNFPAIHTPIVPHKIYYLGFSLSLPHPTKEHISINQQTKVGNEIYISISNYNNHSNNISYSTLTPPNNSYKSFPNFRDFFPFQITLYNIYLPNIHYMDLYTSQHPYYLLVLWIFPYSTFYLRILQLDVDVFVSYFLYYIPFSNYQTPSSITFPIIPSNFSNISSHYSLLTANSYYPIPFYITPKSYLSQMF